MFKAGDLKAAVAAVLERSRDADTLKRVGGAAREYITEYRQWRNNIVQLVEFHHDIQAGKCSPEIQVERASA
jgi:hypothetical protein